LALTSQRHIYVTTCSTKPYADCHSNMRQSIRHSHLPTKPDPDLHCC